MEIKNLEQHSNIKSVAPIDAEKLISVLGRFADGFKELPITSKRSLLNSIFDKIEVGEQEIVLNIKDPGFTILGFKGASPFPCHSGEQSLVHLEGWRGVRDSNPWPSA